MARSVIKYRSLCILFVFCSLSVLPFSAGQEEVITMSVKDMAVADIMKLISEKAGISIIVSQNVTKRATLYLRETPCMDAFNAVVEANGLAAFESMGTYVVMTAQEYSALNGGETPGVRKMCLIPLCHTKVQDAVALVKTLKSADGSFVVSETDNSIAVYDRPGKVALIKEALEQADAGKESRLVSLNYTDAPTAAAAVKKAVPRCMAAEADTAANTIRITAPAGAWKEIDEVIKSIDRESRLETRIIPIQNGACADMAEKIAPHLTSGMGTAVPDERTNSLVLRDLPERLEKAAELIDGLDRPLRAVRIEAKILQVDLKESFSMGINWQAVLKEYGGGEGDMTVTQSFTPIAGAQRPLKGPHYTPDEEKDLVRNAFDAVVDKGTSMIVTGPLFKETDSFQAIVNILAGYGTTRLLSSPRITVLDGKEARIQVGTREPYVTNTVVQSSASATTAEDVTFIDVGVILKVLPKISDNGFIRMEIVPEVSSVVRDFVTAQGNTIPVVSTQKVQTQVIVQDGVPFVLGGLIDTKEYTSTHKTPVLGDIPVLGMPFRRKESRSVQSELVILMTPVIVDGTEPFSAAGMTVTDHGWPRRLYSTLKEALE